METGKKLDTEIMNGFVMYLLFRSTSANSNECSVQNGIVHLFTQLLMCV
jgi:hypothetical protein